MIAVDINEISVVGAIQEIVLIQEIVGAIQEIQEEIEVTPIEEEVIVDHIKEGGKIIDLKILELEAIAEVKVILIREANQDLMKRRQA